MQRLEIDLEGGGRAVLVASSLEVFKRAAKTSWIRKKKGLDLVEAILNAPRTGSDWIASVDFYNKYRKHNDAPNGMAAHQEFHPNGERALALHYSDDRLDDGPNGEPAVQEWDEEGQLIRASFYTKGDRIRFLETKEEVAAWQAEVALAESVKPRKKVAMNLG